MQKGAGKMLLASQHSLRQTPSSVPAWIMDGFDVASYPGPFFFEGGGGGGEGKDLVNTVSVCK